MGAARCSISQYFSKLIAEIRFRIYTKGKNLSGGDEVKNSRIEQICLFLSEKYLGQILWTDTWDKYCGQILWQILWTDIVDKYCGEILWTQIVDKYCGQISGGGVWPVPG